jgi:hypothetical protein
LWKILSVAALCLLQERLPYEGSIPAVGVLTKLDVSAIVRTWRIKGVLWCPWNGSMTPCLWVENAYPCGLLEVVRQQFKSHLPELPPFPLKLTTSSHNHGNLQFAESRVFTFVPPVVQQTEIPIAAPRPKFMINYLSELDALGGAPVCWIPCSAPTGTAPGTGDATIRAAAMWKIRAR